MTSYTAGTVSARIELDTSDFDKEVKSLKGKIDDLKMVLSKNGLMDLNTQIKELQDEVKRLSEANADYKNKLKAVREEKDKLINSGKKQEEQEKKVQKTIDETTKSIDRETEAVKKLNAESKKSGKSVTITTVPNKLHDDEVKQQAILESLKRAYYEYERVARESAAKEKLYWQTRQSAMRNAMENYVGGVRNMVIANKLLFASEGGYNNYINTLSKVRGEFGKINNVNFTKLSKNVYENGQLVLSMGENWRKVQADIVDATTIIRLGFKEVDGELVEVVTGISRASEVLATFNFKLLDGASATATATKRTIELASAMHRLNVQGTPNWQGRNVTGGYSTYLSQLSQINKALDELAKKEKIASGKLGSAWKSNGINLNTYKSNLSKINAELDKQAQKVQKVKNAQLQLQYFQRTDWLNQYKGNMQQINAELEKQTKHTTNTSKSTQNMGNSMKNTAHSGRILSNTLYQIRGALLSLKMIFTAMGGMALWGFATDIAEGVKETFKAKNEMEAQLKQNKKVDTAGYTYFNQQLDEITDRFKKINKYSIGETVSSIGLEFNLSGKEMADFLDITAMIQSEYVRAGRKESEAALAVKDILQGEFQRLSRETGVGKEELVAYGWDEDKTNIEGLTDALRKAALDRHWDVFAAKATSLNDVLTIMKSRFSETGADLMQAATPMIVGAFNDIINAIDGFGKAWDSMGSYNRTMISILGGGGLIGGLLTALPMITKGMGLAEISTMGFGKSLLTAALNLNKAEVAQYGFRKALAATVTGTKAAELAGTRSTKAIMGRILGVKQATLAEHGYLTALVKSRLETTTIGPVMSDASIASMKWYQKLGLLSGGLKEGEAASAGFAKSIGKTIFSLRTLKIAILGITGIALASWFAGVAMWADAVKKRVEAYNNTLANGKKEIKQATNIYDKYQQKLDETDKKSKNYNFLESQTETAKHNVQDLELSLKLAKEIKKTQKDREESHDLTYQSKLNDLYKQSGVNVQKWGQNYLQMKQTAYDLQKAEDERYQFEYKSLQHIKEHVGNMKEAGIAEKDRVKYITEYSTKAQEAAENLKKFNEGDATALLYYAINRLQLIWIDLWNDDHFVKFWDSVKKTWDTLKPTIERITELLGDLGHTLLDMATGFLSTDFGKWTAGLAAAGTVIGLVGLKIGKWVTGSKSVFQVLKKVGGKLKEVADGWKDVGDKAEEADKKTGGDTAEGGETGGKAPTNRKEWWSDTKGKLYQDATKYARAAVAIAAGMLLVSEAIYLLKAPMYALSEVGKDFKTQEPHIRDGIEGLKLIAPVMIVLLPPVIALVTILGKYESAISNSTIIKASVKAAIGIAAGMLLVAEAIYLLKAPLWSISEVGKDFASNKVNVTAGVEAMKVVSDSLQYLLPFVPALAAGIILAIAIFESGPIGLALTGAAIAGVAIGIGLVTEAIYLLKAPLWAIGELGKDFADLSSVKQGSEAIKVTAEALKYVADAMTSLTWIDLNLLAQTITDLLANWLGTDLGTKLTDLTKEGGLLQQLSDFAKAFNSSSYTIEAPNPDKVSALAAAGDGVKTIGDAMLKVKQAMDNLPTEFKNNANTGEQLGITGNNTNGTSSTTTTDVQGYFDTFKEPLRQLKSFVYDFNHSDEFTIEPIDPSRVASISQAADMITQINDAVEKVKTTMGNIAGSQWNTAQAEGGVLSAVGNWLYHNSGSGTTANGQGTGDYKSSLGSQLKEMEDVIADLFTFQTNVAQYGSGEGGEGTDVGSLTNMVTIIQDAISQVSQALSDAVPQFKDNGHSLSGAIVNGFNEGAANIKSLGSGVVAKIANGIMTNKDMLYNTANSLGKTAANKFKDGVNPMSTYMNTELDYVKQAMTNRQSELGDTAYNLGSHIASRFKEGDDINSPGLMARAMQDEVNYMSESLTNNNLGDLAYSMGNSLSDNFNLDFNLSNIQLPDVTPFTDNLGVIPSTVTGVKDTVSSDFTTMNTNIGGAFKNIVANTRTNMGNMLSATTKNIGAIRTSWRGMQDALISSAEHIKTQTTRKINTLKGNLGDFWNKLQHPDQLIGSAGGHTGTVRRHYAIKTPKLFAGGDSAPSSADPSFMKEYLKCLMSGTQCFAGGWNFDWKDKIQDKFNNWNTHFGKWHLDDYLKVGKFSNSNFPVRNLSEGARAAIAKSYIFDTIAATNYSKYFNSHFGDDPVAALRAGAFNCWDGTNVVLALARAFGFSGSMGHGTWNGIGHVWASIPGLGIIDPTAIQQRRSFTSSAVKGYAGPAGTIRRTSSGSGSVVGNTTNNEVHIHINGDVYGVDDLNKKIEDGANRVARKLFTKNLSGV